VTRKPFEKITFLPASGNNAEDLLDSDGWEVVERYTDPHFPDFEHDIAVLRVETKTDSFGRPITLQETLGGALTTATPPPGVFQGTIYGYPTAYQDGRRGQAYMQRCDGDYSRTEGFRPGGPGQSRNGVYWSDSCQLLPGNSGGPLTSTHNPRMVHAVASSTVDDNGYKWVRAMPLDDEFDQLRARADH
jgi:hypothetical protein